MMNKKNRTSLHKMLALLMLPLLLQGCADAKMSELRAYKGEVLARKPGRITPLPEIIPIETFAFVSEGLRNPFKIESNETEDIQAPSNTDLRPDGDRATEELEQFPLDALRMVGTLEQNTELWGLITTSGGTIHRVETGNYMGQNYGRVTRVEEEGIYLTEIVSDGRGGYQERQATVALSEQ